MASRAKAPQRDQLLTMAETRESLAEDRDKQISRQERIKALDIDSVTE